MNDGIPLPARHRDVRPAPSWARVAGAAAIGHAVGATIGVVLLAGPAGRWSTITMLLLVHVIADLGAGLAAARFARWSRPGHVVGAVLTSGMLASVGVLGLLGTAPGWLLVRAAVVVVVAVVSVGPSPPAPARPADGARPAGWAR